MPDSQNDISIILFDGVCNFCNSSVNKIIKYDKKNKLKFAALQSDTGKKILEKHARDADDHTAGPRRADESGRHDDRQTEPCKTARLAN